MGRLVDIGNDDLGAIAFSSASWLWVHVSPVWNSLASESGSAMLTGESGHEAMGGEALELT